MASQDNEQSFKTNVAKDTMDIGLHISQQTFSSELDKQKHGWKWDQKKLWSSRLAKRRRSSLFTRSSLRD